LKITKLHDKSLPIFWQNLGLASILKQAQNELTHMEAKFSQRVKDVISFSREEALRLGHDYIGTEHLLLGIIREGEGMAVQVLTSLGVDLFELRRNIESVLKTNLSKPVNNLGNIPLIKQAERALKFTYLEARAYNTELIETEHLLLSILKVELPTTSPNGSWAC
jgi:ATP-dependent Clp protease ATP-binding subunit ClpC